MMGSTALSIVLWAMAVAFLLDFWIEMGRVERTIVLLAVIGVAIWTIVKYLAPALKVHESDTALAVMVDNMHSMHSDLVGALQFADEGRSQYGSEQLREAVVEYTGKAAGELNFLEGFSRKELLNRLLIFAATVLICLTPAVVYATYTGAFLKRMVLFDVRYPTRTTIEIISPTPDQLVAEGQPVTFRVDARHASGPESLPKTGVVWISTTDRDVAEPIELTRRGSEKDVPAVYSGALESVKSDLMYTVSIGDAKSDPRYLKLIPRPQVELELKVTAPKYAGGKTPTKSANRRKAVVLEGSKVVPVITCRNKELVKGEITFIKGSEKDKNLEKKTYEMKLEGGALVFDTDGSPLSVVTEIARFEITATDVNGQTPENPVKGSVHIAADLPPRVALMAFSRYIVPGAAPELRFRAIDDYALDEITLHLEIIDADGGETKLKPIALRKPRDKNGKRLVDYSGSYTLNMTSMKLQKGYQISALIDVIDYRGKLEGKSRQSEKWIFEITDNAGVLEAMDRLTEEMDQKLDEILRAQLEAGK
ncbi:MAG: hypothetical protein QGG42_06375 [Phycisphaerae bacterium]|jgi:hypothetical protein|nr:hypothetical protein [Phycisphaerae bacterium]